MKRRAFLKLVAAAPLAGLVPKHRPYHWFDPTKQYGGHVRWRPNKPGVSEDLWLQAKLTIPPDYRKHIRIIMRSNHSSMGWRYTPPGERIIVWDGHNPIDPQGEAGWNVYRVFGENNRSPLVRRVRRIC